jgi:hypothetical protein
MTLKECPNCITYAICRSQLIDMISDSPDIGRINFNVNGSLAYILITKCEKEMLPHFINDLTRRGDGPSDAVDRATLEILKIFNIDYYSIVGTNVEKQEPIIKE